MPKAKPKKSTGARGVGAQGGKVTVRERRSNDDIADDVSRAFRIVSQLSKNNPGPVSAKSFEEEMKLSRSAARHTHKELERVFRNTRITKQGFQFRTQGSDDRYFWRQIQRNAQLKEDVGVCAAALLRSSRVLACSPGTTVSTTVRCCLESEGRYSIITNNLSIAAQFDVLGGSQLTLIGGEYDPQTHATLGPQAEEAIKSLNFDTAVVGVSGVNAKGNLYVAHDKETPLLKRFVENENVERIVIVATIDKLGDSDLHGFARLDDLRTSSNKTPRITLVTNPIDQFPRAESISDDEFQRRRENASHTVDQLRKYIVEAESVAVPNKR